MKDDIRNYIIGNIINNMIDKIRFIGKIRSGNDIRDKIGI